MGLVHGVFRPSAVVAVADAPGKSLPIQGVIPEPSTAPAPVARLAADLDGGCLPWRARNISAAPPGRKASVAAGKGDGGVHFSAFSAPGKSKRLRGLMPVLRFPEKLES